MKVKTAGKRVWSSSRVFRPSVFSACRQLKQTKTSDELLEQYRCEIQELKLKQRKQRYYLGSEYCWGANKSRNVSSHCNQFFCRIKFENQLYQLMEHHKILNSMFVCYSINKYLTQLVTCQKMTNGQVNNIIKKYIYFLDSGQPSRWNTKCREHSVSVIIRW